MTRNKKNSSLFTDNEHQKAYPVAKSITLLRDDVTNKGLLKNPYNTKNEAVPSGGVLARPLRITTDTFGNVFAKSDTMLISGVTNINMLQNPDRNHVEIAPTQRTLSRQMIKDLNNGKLPKFITQNKGVSEISYKLIMTMPNIGAKLITIEIIRSLITNKRFNAKDYGGQHASKAISYFEQMINDATKAHRAGMLEVMIKTILDKYVNSIESVFGATIRQTVPDDEIATGMRNLAEISGVLIRLFNEQNRLEPDNNMTFEQIMGLPPSINSLIPNASPPNAFFFEGRQDNQPSPPQGIHDPDVIKDPTNDIKPEPPNSNLSHSVSGQAVQNVTQQQPTNNPPESKSNILRNALIAGGITAGLAGALYLYGMSIEEAARILFRNPAGLIRGDQRPPRAPPAGAPPAGAPPAGAPPAGAPLAGAPPAGALPAGGQPAGSPPAPLIGVVPQMSDALAGGMPGYEAVLEQKDAVDEAVSQLVVRQNAPSALDMDGSMAQAVVHPVYSAFRPAIVNPRASPFDVIHDPFGVARNILRFVEARARTGQRTRAQHAIALEQHNPMEQSRVEQQRARARRLPRESPAVEVKADDELPFGNDLSGMTQSEYNRVVWLVRDKVVRDLMADPKYQKDPYNTSGYTDYINSIIHYKFIDGDPMTLQELKDTIREEFIKPSNVDGYGYKVRTEQTREARRKRGEQLAQERKERKKLEADEVARRKSEQLYRPVVASIHQYADLVKKRKEYTRSVLPNLMQGFEETAYTKASQLEAKRANELEAIIEETKELTEAKNQLVSRSTRREELQRVRSQVEASRQQRQLQEAFKGWKAQLSQVEEGHGVITRLQAEQEAVQRASQIEHYEREVEKMKIEDIALSKVVEHGVQLPTVNEWALDESPLKYSSKLVSEYLKSEEGIIIPRQMIRNLWNQARMYTPRKNPEYASSEIDNTSETISLIIAEELRKGTIALPKGTIMGEKPQLDPSIGTLYERLKNIQSDTVVTTPKQENQKRQIVLAKRRKAFVTAAKNKLAIDRAELIKKFESAVADMEKETSDLIESLKSKLYSPFEMAAQPPDVRAVLETAQEIAEQEQKANVPFNASELERSTMNTRQLIDLTENVDFRRVVDFVNEQRILKHELTSDDAKKLWIIDIISTTSDINKMRANPEEYVANAICDRLEDIRDLVAQKPNPDLPDEAFFFDEDPQPIDIPVDKPIEVPIESSLESSVPLKKPKRQRRKKAEVAPEEPEEKQEGNVPVPNRRDSEATWIYEASYRDGRSSTPPPIYMGNYDWKKILATLYDGVIQENEERLARRDSTKIYKKGTYMHALFKLYKQIIKDLQGHLPDMVTFNRIGTQDVDPRKEERPETYNMLQGVKSLRYTDLQKYMQVMTFAIEQYQRDHNIPQGGRGMKRHTSSNAPKAKKASKKEIDDIDAMIMAILKK